jgi:hypothetical protein
MREITKYLSILIVAVLASAATCYSTPVYLAPTKIAQDEKNFDNGEATDETSTSFYELAYAKATSEQREELDRIFADKSIGLPGEWRRPVLITVGDLPKDTNRLSAEQAAKLFDSKVIGDLESEFNKIAGAPDFVGGSGIERSIYFLNDDRSEAIILMLGDVFHIVFNEDGTQTRLPVGTQTLP